MKTQNIQQKNDDNDTYSDGYPPNVSEPEVPRLTSTSDAQEIQKNTRKFEALLQKSKRVLLKISAVFPFDLFPDKIVIDENKVNIIHREFLFSPTIQSYVIQDINDVVVESSIFFATLKLLPNGFSEDWVSVKYLKKRDAVEAKRIIAGLKVGMKSGVDLTKVVTSELNKKIATLGASC